ncbi:PTS sugar transporter subunit IIA [Opitutus sp. ER46]|uniref:PTS sugar transporter subunit IIA n=1 Tax=Opitutus sp. ER46 TaxID=2161864 RepID=UPI000D3200CF|nr:PTS sugar transporter subunit IIA [Opitutus sp. ER46]PTX90828.1 PTS sugar transporter subunit IIA [Opitutus sp. ER46]
MYLNLVQIAESFGVSENVIEDWIRSEGLPHVPERGRLLFDRAQVANWAAARGLAAQAGFLAPAASTQATSWPLETLLRQGGIWRNLPLAEITPTLVRIVETLPATAPAVRQLVAQRIKAPSGVTLAPVGGGFALPHPSARIALGRDSGTVALLLLNEPVPTPEPAVDGLGVTKLFFFIAPSPRAHLDILGRLSRLLSRGPVRDLVNQGASDAEILNAVAAADAAPALPRSENKS